MLPLHLPVDVHRRSTRGGSVRVVGTAPSTSNGRRGCVRPASVPRRRCRVHLIQRCRVWDDRRRVSVPPTSSWYERRTSRPSHARPCHPGHLHREPEGRHVCDVRCVEVRVSRGDGATQCGSSGTKRPRSFCCCFERKMVVCTVGRLPGPRKFRISE